MKVKQLQAYKPTPPPREKDIPALTEKANKGDTAAKTALGLLHLEAGDVPEAQKLLKELAAANRNGSGTKGGASEGKSPKKNVHIMLNTSEEAEEFNKTVAEERKGNKSPYLTRAVLMDMDPKELAARIKAGTDPNVEDPVFGFALVQAIEQRRSVEMVKTLLENGADPNKGNPLLKVLGRKGELVSLLLKAGANPMTVDYEKTPALTRAVKNDNIEAAAALLKAGAKAEAKDKDGNTALYYALDRSKSPEIVKLLLENGASPKSFPALTVLSWREKNIPTALLLLKHGASASAKDRDGNTLVHWAVRDGSLELLQAAIKAKTPVTGTDEDGYTPLRSAVVRGNAEMAAALLGAGADPNRKTKDGRTPLDVCRNEEIAKLLEKAGGVRTEEKN